MRSTADVQLGRKKESSGDPECAGLHFSARRRGGGGGVPEDDQGGYSEEGVDVCAAQSHGVSDVSHSSRQAAPSPAITGPIATSRLRTATERGGTKGNMARRI
eukprot:3039378-Pyramimonas_sp.AAC.2